MPIYGYNREDDDATAPQVLSEVTFELQPKDLRRVASFLVASADAIESGTFIDGGRHLRDYNARWSAQAAGDVIVVPPRPDQQDQG